MAASGELRLILETGCKTCAARGVKCPGFEVRLAWPSDMAGSKRKGRHLTARSSAAPASVSAITPRQTPEESMIRDLSPLGLPAEESFLMQHFLQNVSRISLAVDNNENGYRLLLPLALAEPSLLNATLAVAASHHSRWQHTVDLSSRKYLRASCTSLRDRFADPELIRQPATLASMLFLATYEVFLGSVRWRGHYDAIREWVRSRGDCSDVDSFLLNWVCLLDTQSAINLGTSSMPELDPWMDSSTQGNTVDVLFGCSARLPRLMAEASRLYVSSRDGLMTPDQVSQQAEHLQQQIGALAIDPESSPSIGLSCTSTSHSFSTTVGMDEEELRKRAVATAEIFRHASHIYVHRIAHGPGETLPPDMRRSLDTALGLLTMVPDARGPGANLGWCLVVLGAELDGADERDYITARWENLHLLALSNNRNGQRTLEEAWRRRDLVASGRAEPERWQDTMLRIGESQILV
ncbi:fungal-specific transcription factor domain-containing protein [Plectosphaerella plurivora]|uniref:Fungal-specific transcription factor domain-containing protein n=1 Tax=Plectosphaerella plurivora TaxID=936078 RepID=A0A9P9A6Q6_9PEZI|nr:fungal-specific transcription factor domain-containing protein [Plectosphaerella plurivora]